MNNWLAIINLVSETWENDEYGIRKKVESLIPVRANISATRASEFHSASQNGIRASEYTFTIPIRKYSKQTELEYKGERLSIYRAYQVSDDHIELHCEKKVGTNG